MNKELTKALYDAGMNEPNVRAIAKAMDDHEEVHLLRLALGEEIKQWQSLDDHEPMSGGNPAYAQFITSLQRILGDSYIRDDNRGL